MTIRRKQILYGRIVHSKSLKHLEILPAAALGVSENGTICFLDSSVGSAQEAQAKYPNFVSARCTTLTPSQFLFPGLIDTHLHAPQWPNLAIGMEGNLREWVEQYTDPIEASYKDPRKAEVVYDELVRKELALGTTTCAYNSSIHWQATNILADKCKKYGQRAVIGKLCIMQGSTSGNWETDVETSIADEKKSIDYIRSIDPSGTLVMPCIQPRGGSYMPPGGMRGLGQLCNTTYSEEPLRVQAHMCETQEDVTRTLQAHPDFASCAAMYNGYGLLHSRTILAHCIHLTDADKQLLQQTGAGVAHCPNSNTCLRDGWCHVRDLLDLGIKVGLGTDCSAGYTTSMLDAMRSASNVSRHLAISSPSSSTSTSPILSFPELLYLSTLGSAQVLSLDSTLGNFDPGKHFDALLIDTGLEDDMINSRGWEKDDLALVKKWVFLGDDRSIRKVWVGGRVVGGKDRDGKKKMRRRD